VNLISPEDLIKEDFKKWFEAQVEWWHSAAAFNGLYKTYRALRKSLDHDKSIDALQSTISAIRNEYGD